MHPLSFSARLYDPGPAKVGEVPGNLRLSLLQNLHEVADTDLTSIHEIQKSQAGWVGKRREQLHHVDRLCGSAHAINIRLDRYV
jgi:hypothetical protein